jgi:hypothetical protein
MSDPLQRLARRVENDPRFLACFLVEYARSEPLDDAGLARELGCEEATLTRLRLCRAPRPEAADFRRDVRQIAEHFAVDAVRLTEILRQGEAFRLLQQGGVGAPGFLMAARDRPEETPPCSDENEP